jgi:hypothetical protein
MQSLAFLWFELQTTQQYLRDKAFGPAQSPASSANLNTPIGAGTRRRASAKQVPRMPFTKQRRVASPKGLASLAVKALVEEAELTPKPALVDGRGPGAQADLSLSLMRRSAHCLAPFFELMALSSLKQIPTQTLREELGTIGRWTEHSNLVAQLMKCYFPLCLPGKEASKSRILTFDFRTPTRRGVILCAGNSP